MPPAVKPDPDNTYTVEAITRQIAGAIEDRFADVWVQGEITGFNKHASGHWYFSIKDSQAVLQVTAFRGVNYRIRFEPKNGMQVLIRGKISVYAVQGKYQLNAEQMLPKGIGEFELAFQQMRTKLDRKGYFDQDRKKPIPTYPTRIAIVTSPSGAAIRDMLETLSRRWPVARILVCPVKVQGDDAKDEIAATIDLLNAMREANRIRLDVMIVGRGGGSLEDLWAFNEEKVATAIFQSRVPVISAVGHETDITISCLTADRRALTPTDAATQLTPDIAELRFALDEAHRRMGTAVKRRVETGLQQLDAISRRRVFREPAERLKLLQQRVTEQRQRMQRALANRMTRASESLSARAARLESLSPLNVLSRGYSLTQKADGVILRETSGVSVGDEITTRLQSGRLISRVERIEETS
jgi:exodeoxyribonuclease VII large subunit